MPPPERGASLRLTLACQIEAVRPAILAIRTFLREQGVADLEVTACELSLTEAANNAVIYARDRRDRPVTLEAFCGDRTIELRVEDHTRGFDWPEKVGLPDADQEGGRGLYLICSVMDEIAYLRGHDTNLLVMRRQRRTPARPAAVVPRVELEELRRLLTEDERVIRDMAEELSSCYESLSAIFRYGGELARTVDIQDFSRRLLDDLLRITGADWYVVRLVSEGENQLVSFVASEASLMLPTLDIEARDRPPSVELDALKNRRDEFFEKLGEITPGDPLHDAKPGAVGLVHPICFGDRLIGTVAVGKMSTDFGFTAARVNVVQTFADFLAMQIVEDRLERERVASLLVGKELDIARRIQETLLMRGLPGVAGLDLAAHCESARQVGGDFYDAIPVGDGSVLLVVCDVMGKGIPAAMFAVILRSLMRAMVKLAPHPAGLLTRLNSLLFEELTEVEMFITTLVVYLDLPERRCRVASAGHCPLLWINDPSRRVSAASPEGVPLGVLRHPNYENQEIQWTEALRLILYTDGLTEAMDPQGHMFGQQRLVQWFQNAPHQQLTAAELREQLVARLNQFRSTQPLADDQTFIMVKADPRP